MTTSLESCLSSKILSHLNISDEVTCNFLEPDGQFVFRLPTLQMQVSHFYFLENRIPPKGVPVLVFIKLSRFCNSFRNLNTELVSLYPIFGFQFGNDSIALAQGIRDPPRKGFFFYHAHLNRILDNLDRVRYLQVLEGNPCGAIILPPHEKLPP